MLNSTDLENLYTKIDGHILLVAAYTQDDSFIRIIRSCRLKPYSIFTNNFQYRTKLESHWVDEFGNSLQFKGITPRILMNDTQVSDNTKISTDLFFGRSIDTTADSSSDAFIVSGKFLDRDFYIVAFYGQDEYIRAFAYNKKWTRISPLLLGLNTLRELFRHAGKRMTEIDKKRLDIALHFNVERCVLASLPMKESMPLFFNKEILTFYKGI